jgi:RNA polymerase sigma-70 factor, ECF subfamily
MPETVSVGSNVPANPVREAIFTNEASLIARILAGEKDLYYTLVSPYERVIYTAAFSLLRNAADAEDCAQEAILKGFRHLGTFKGQSKFVSWLVRIAFNEAKMKLRKLRSSVYESLDSIEYDQDGEYVPQCLQDWREIPSESLERKEVREIIEDAIESLPSIYKQVFVLRDIQGHDVDATAQILGVSTAVVKTRLVRARLQLRDLLAPKIKNSQIFTRERHRRGKAAWL